MSPHTYYIIQIVKGYCVNGDVEVGGVLGGGVWTASLDASQWADLSVFKGNVVCLTGAPRRSGWAN